MTMDFKQKRLPNNPASGSYRSHPGPSGGETTGSKAGTPLFASRSSTAAPVSDTGRPSRGGEIFPPVVDAALLANLWQAGKKGLFFQKLRVLDVCDPEIERFVEANLYGDDYWLARNLLTHGPEHGWPIHLKVEREMKGWEDSGGKGCVFQLLRDAAGREAQNFDLWMTLAICFGVASDDFWLASNLMVFGREDIWPLNLQIERLVKGWPGVDGSVGGILAFIHGLNPDDQTAAFDGLQQLHADYLARGRPKTQTATIEQVLHAHYADIARTQAPGARAPSAGWPVGGAPAALTAGTKALSPEQKRQARLALTPTGKPVGDFLPAIPGKGTYAARVKKVLVDYIETLYQTFVVGKGPAQHDDPDKVYPPDKILDIGKQAKKAADRVFGSYHVGRELQWRVNIADRFELEQLDLQNMTLRQKREKAQVLVKDLLQANATIRQVINTEHHARPDRTTPPPSAASRPAMSEAAILKRIVEELTNDPHEVERLNRIDRGWPAAVPLGGGTIQIQRFKSDTDTGNQKFLWATFQALIHEYMHTLAHPDYNAYADSFGRRSPQWNTLIEGVNSLLTEIVWSRVDMDSLRPEIEGPRLAALPLDASLVPITKHRYPSYRAAVRLVTAVGIRNLYAAYFLGRVDLIGR